MAKVAINVSKGKLQEESDSDIIVGIDLGTTHSLVAYIDSCNGQPVCLAHKGSSNLVPSIIHFTENNEVLVGDAARQKMLEAPERTIFSVKRLMGKSYKDVASYKDFFSYKVIDNDNDSLVKVQVGDKFYSPIELSSYVLKELKNISEQNLNRKITKAVITVPAYFNDAQRQATKDAGKLAGLDVLRIVNEPTAASLAYGIGLQKDESKTIAVYDLGGGTFDVSILQIHADAGGGVFEVLSTNGNTFLGGDDFDKLIMEYWIAEQVQHTLNEHDRQLLRLCAEKAKKQLSSQAHFETEIVLANNEKVTLHISKEKFESLIQPLVTQTTDCCKQALADAKLTTVDIQAVVMVGGSTRVPMVKATIKDFFNQELYDKLNPDEVVALGAAIQANVLAGNQKDVLLLDVTPLSLGIETMGGLMDVIIPRNSKIPTRSARSYTTSKDGQANLKIAVYQGERDLVQHNRKLAEFVLSGIPAMPAGLPKVEIQFLLNADGILVVKAKELRSGLEQSVEVKPQYGLTDTEVENMLLSSLENAKDDIAIRALVEARTEAEQLLDVTEKFVQKNKDLLSPDEISGTQSLMAKLKNEISSNDKNAIQHQTEELNDYTRPFAERVMDIAIATAMKGKKLN